MCVIYCYGHYSMQQAAQNCSLLIMSTGYAEFINKKSNVMFIFADVLLRLCNVTDTAEFVWQSPHLHILTRGSNEEK